MLTISDIHPDVKKMTDAVMKAAQGRPIKRSLTAEKNMEEVTSSLVRRLLLLQLDQQKQSGGEQGSQGTQSLSPAKEPAAK